MDGSSVEALMIHAIYLLNPASEKAEFREKSLAALTVSMSLAGSRFGWSARRVRCPRM